MRRYLLFGKCHNCERNVEDIILERRSRGAEEIPPQDALFYVRKGGKTVIVCLDCAAESTANGETLDEVLDAALRPLRLPPGITQMQHTCPMLMYDGFTEAEATRTIPFQLVNGYWRGSCPDCGVTVLSAEKKEEAAPEETAPSSTAVNAAE